MNQGQARVACPRCGANNFVGQTSCWQCQVSLPPPESLPNVQAPAPAPPMLPELPTPARPGSKAHWSPYYQSARAGVNLWPLRLAAIVITLFGAIFAAAYYTRVRNQAAAIDSGAQAAIDANQKLMQDLDDRIRNPRSISNPDALDPDSLSGQARREMERLQREHGIAPPPASGDGRIHLQGGGSISPEEYRRARESLRGK